MAEIMNFYGEHIGISELKLKDFNVRYKLVKENDYFIVKKIGDDKIKLDKKLIGKNGIIIFYSIGCNVCRSKIEFWTNIASNYIYSFPIYAVNCDNMKDKNDYLLPLLKIQKYPYYMKFDKKGVIEPLNLNITLEDILYYISNNTT
jgi:thiol-disulfide isomerase/thioredoxin